MGSYEVTQAQWQSLMEGNRLSFKDCGENCPVNTAWDEAQEFINKLNAQNDGYTYRLPSEAEWEYACRAETTGDYAGDLNSMAWYADNSDRKVHPVGQKQPNAWGLYDMHGNVDEWVMDYYHNTYDGAPTDGSAWASRGEQEYRVVRGGTYSDNIHSVRSYTRGRSSATSFRGLRVVAVARS
jgi:formylglycine-generating enzyme required for sulfatase activity